MGARTFVRAPHVVTAKQHQCRDVDCKRWGKWLVRDGENSVSYWVSDEAFRKEYVEVPEGEEAVIFHAPAKEDIAVPHETVTQKATLETYR